MPKKILPRARIIPYGLSQHYQRAPPKVLPKGSPQRFSSRDVTRKTTPKSYPSRIVTGGVFKSGRGLK